MSDITPNPETHIALFQRKEVRRTIHNNEWWFVISDVITALTDSVDPSQYLKRIRQRDPQLNEAFKGGVQIVPPLGIEFDTAGGRQLLQCWNTEGLFRHHGNHPYPRCPRLPGKQTRCLRGRHGRRKCPPRIGKKERSPGCHPRGIFAEPCDLSAEAIQAKGEAMDAIPPCGNLPAMLRIALQAGPQGLLAKKGQ